MASILGTYWILLCITSVLFVTIDGQSAIYPFSNGTNVIRPIESDGHMVNISSSPLIFMGHYYNQLWIHKDGIISFSEKDKYRRNVDWTASPVSLFYDKPFIAPFYYNAMALDAEVGSYTGHIYYVMRKTLDSITPSLSTFGQYIRSQTVGPNNFNPTWALEVTWSNVTDNKQLDSGCAGTLASPCLTNTFQVVLLSDGTSSYTIMNYGSMNIPAYKDYQAGFNGGNGTGWTSVYPSGGVGQLSAGRGSDTVGRYIFKVSSPTIVRGGCSSDTSLTALSIYPNYGGMFGGKVIDIAGPCFTRSQQILCRFGDLGKANDTAVFVSQNLIRCTVPRLLERGWITLSVSTNNGMSYPYKADFFVVFPGRLPPTENLEATYTAADLAWYSLTAARLTVKWRASLLSNVSSSQVDINLFGYTEINGQGQFGLLTKLGSIQNSGSFSFPTSSFLCTGQMCTDHQVGLLEVRLQTQYSPVKYRFLSSKSLPLGWYVKQTMTTQYGSNWPAAKCNSWHGTDVQLNQQWLQQQPSCPCTMEQAMADFGRWQADVSCNINNQGNAGNCYYHSGAVHCVRSVQPVQAGGNQCCYGNNHLLMYTSDTNQGSSPDRSHDWGASPYVTPGRVPSLSHWIDDVIPFYYCCIWSKPNSCGTYMGVRKTRDCTGYTPPVPASVFGQGHVYAFGGQMYRMYGPGDYTLLKSGNTVVQGRFQPNLFPTENGVKVSTSFPLSAVAIQDVGTSDIVEIRLIPSTFHRRDQMLEVRVNKKFVNFNVPELFWQDFKGVSIVNTDTTVPNVQSNFTVLLTNGIGFQLAAKNHILEFDVMVPQSFSNFSGNVTGLLGGLSGNLATRNGTNITLQDMVNVNSQTPIQQQQYAVYLYNFQLSWAIYDAERIFRDSLPANNSQLYGILSGPVNLLPTTLPGASSGTAQSICPGNPACIFDYMHTGSVSLARATNAGTIRNAYLRSSTQTVRSCGLLNVPFASKSNYNYILNSTVTLIACSSGTFSGPSQYTCSPTSNTTQAWSPAVTSTCSTKTASANIGMIVGIIVAIVVFICVVIIVAYLAARKRRVRRNSRDRKGQQARYDPDADIVRTEKRRTSSEGPTGKGNEYSM